MYTCKIKTAKEHNRSNIPLDTRLHLPIHTEPWYMTRISRRTTTYPQALVLLIRDLRLKHLHKLT